MGCWTDERTRGIFLFKPLRGHSLIFHSLLRSYYVPLHPRVVYYSQKTLKRENEIMKTADTHIENTIGLLQAVFRKEPLFIAV